jgi:U3 small nucleolar RNA-associated protein 21
LLFDLGMIMVTVSIRKFPAYYILLTYLDTHFIEHLKTLSPSAADLEIRSLNPGVESESDELVSFVNALTSRLKQKRDYELVQAWMTVFLRLHMDAVDEKLKEALREWRQCQESEGARLGDLVGFCSGVVGFLRSPRT